MEGMAGGFEVLSFCSTSLMEPSIGGSLKFCADIKISNSEIHSEIEDKGTRVRFSANK
jgi:hypothetical protein